MHNCIRHTNTGTIRLKSVEVFISNGLFVSVPYLPNLLGNLCNKYTVFHNYQNPYVTVLQFMTGKFQILHIIHPAMD